MIIYLLIFIVLIIIFIFSSKSLSPIPYFPTQKVDLPKIIKALNLKQDQTVVDLGAGDGGVVFKAAKEANRRRLNTKFVAVDINPVLILIMYLKRLFHPNRKNIRIILGDMFKIDLNVIARNKVTKQSLFLSFPRSSLSSPRRRGSSLDSPLQGNDVVFYLYISPWFIDKTLQNIQRQISEFCIVSYMYPVKSLKNKEKIIQGKNKIFIYK